MALEDDDDVQNVYADFDIDDEVMERLSAQRLGRTRRAQGGLTTAARPSSSQTYIWGM